MWRIGESVASRQRMSVGRKMRGGGGEENEVNRGRSQSDHAEAGARASLPYLQRRRTRLAVGGVGRAIELTEHPVQVDVSRCLLMHDRVVMSGWRPCRVPVGEGSGAHGAEEAASLGGAAQYEGAEVVWASGHGLPAMRRLPPDPQKGRHACGQVPRVALWESNRRSLEG